MEKDAFVFRSPVRHLFQTERNVPHFGGGLDIVLVQRSGFEGRDSGEDQVNASGWITVVVSIQGQMQAACEAGTSEIRFSKCGIPGG
jgi:hypothetical protein